MFGRLVCAGSGRWPGLAFVCALMVLACGQPAAAPDAAVGSQSDVDAISAGKDTSADSTAADAPLDTDVEEVGAATADAAPPDSSAPADGTASDVLADQGGSDSWVIDAGGGTDDTGADSGTDAVTDAGADATADSTAPDVATDASSDTVPDGAADAGDPLAKPCQSAADCPSSACSTAACVAGWCAATPIADGVGCVPSDPCVAAATCQAGQCKATAAKPCDDQNPCTIDSCQAGACQHTAQAKLPCSDGNPCTKNDTCDASGQCNPGGYVCKTCASHKDCAVQDDGNPCNGTLYCNLEKAKPVCEILPGSAVVCDASADTACTRSTCDPATGQCAMQALAAGTACDDGNPCTPDEACSGGKCTAKSNLCGCSSTADCAVYDDGKLCNGALMCGTQKTCVVAAGSVPFCSASSDPCIVKACDPQKGKCAEFAAPDGVPCSDGNGFTVGDACKAGACQPGTNVGICKSNADCQKLEDGNLCNGTLFCNKAIGKCQDNPATVVYCPSVDDTFCLVNQCQPKTGLCALVPRNDSKACDDGNACTVGEACQSGACAASAVACQCQSDADCQKQEDGNLCNGTLYCDKWSGTCELNPATVVVCPQAQGGPCLATQCQPKTGQCVTSGAGLDGKACDDGMPCTVGEVCTGGQCLASADTCQCQSDGDCAAFDDGNACNGKLFCNKAKGQCEVNPASVVVCATSGDGPCQQTACDAASGKCVTKAAWNGAKCDADANPCTAGDYCDQGECKAGTMVCGCQSDLDCVGKQGGNLCIGSMVCDLETLECKPTKVVVCDNSGDGPCATTACNPASGKCETTARPDATLCGDSGLCTAAPQCAGGQCAKAVPVNCDDAEPCTLDTCDPSLGGCQHAVQSGGPCDDGTVCTQSDFCNKGNCVGTLIACNDNQPCTDDPCDPLIGCMHLPVAPTDCDDQDPCSVGDSCVAGKCVAGKLLADCDDLLPCTSDACVKNVGCTHKAISGGLCDDGDPCTYYTVCIGGACKGLAVQCDDGDPCTADGCKPLVGCTFVALANGATCSDGDPCTSAEVCSGGACKGTSIDCSDLEPCTVDSCSGGQCVHSLTKGACDDGSACTAGDICLSGKCLGSPVSCDDQQPCTVDSCDKLTGCAHAVATGVPCNDGDPCTLPDTCTTSAAGSVCKGLPIDCDDQNACTLDQCKQGACVSTANAQADGTACDDGSLCTADDLCVKGTCKGVVATCSGGTPCTIASCHPLLGCKYAPRTGSCEDDNPCTLTGECVSGQCIAPAKQCADGNPCTDDSCNVKTGACQFVPNQSPCNDNNPCTAPDTCTSGGCAGAPADVAKLCGDGNPCTADTCSATLGCVQTPIAGPCSDGNFCNGLEQCVGAKCTAATTLPCDDGNPCTIDECDTKIGACSWQVEVDGKDCDDGEPCTTATKCAAGVCKGAPLVCNDGNACTADSCKTGQGCVFVPLENACPSGQPCDLGCDDGNACTVGESCKASACQGATALLCDDGSLCTSDACDPKKGCVFTPLGEGAACGAGPNSCGIQGVCKSGACIGEDVRPVTVSGFAPADSVCRGVSADGLGGWLVAGDTPGSNGSSPMLVRLWPTGKVAWTAKLAGVVGRYTAVDLYAAGTAVAVGVRTAATLGGQDAFVARLDASGNPLTILDFATTGDETLDAVAVVDGGAAIVAGSRDSTDMGRQGTFAKIDASGKVVWQKVFGTLIDDGVTILVKRPGGGAFFAGQVGKNAGWIGAVDDSGKLLWEWQPSNPAGLEVHGLALLADGSLAAVGRSGSTGAIFKASSQGTQQAVVTSTELQFDAVTQMANGGVALAGRAGNAVTVRMAAKLGIDVADLRWTRQPAVSGTVIGTRELSADGVQVFTSTCGTWRTDAFGNLDCPTSGTCAFAPWSKCEDNSRCTPVDQCQKGQCLHPSPVVCATDEPCLQSDCQPATGTCKLSNANEGKACAGQADSPCLVKGICKSGVCEGWGLEFWESRLGGDHVRSVEALADNTFLIAREEFGEWYAWDCGGKAFIPKAWTLQKMHSGGKSLLSMSTVQQASVLGNAIALKNGGYAVGGASYGSAFAIWFDGSGTQLGGAGLAWGDGWPRFEGGYGTVIAEEVSGKYLYGLGVLSSEGADATHSRWIRGGQLDWSTGNVAQFNLNAGWRLFPERLEAVPSGGLFAVTQQQDIVPGWGGQPWENPPFTQLRRLYRLKTDGSVIWTKLIAEDVDETDGGATWTPLGPVAVSTRKELVADTPVYYLMVRAYDTEGNLRWEKKLFPDTDGLWSQVSWSAGRLLIAGHSGPYKLPIGWRTVLLQLDDQGKVIEDRRWYDNYRAEYNANGPISLGSADPGSNCSACDPCVCFGCADLTHIVSRWVHLAGGGIVGYDDSPGRLVRVNDFGIATCEQAGKCATLHWNDCDDGKVCTADTCVDSLGCKSLAFDDGAPCSDGQSCTVDDACNQGSCVGGSKAAADTPCDDGVACTQGSTCSSGGVCVSGPSVCQ